MTIRLSRVAAVFDGLHRVAQQIQQNLEHAVFVHRHRRDLGVIALQYDCVAIQSGPQHGQGVLYQFRQRNNLDQTGRLGIALLPGDDLLDVPHVAGEQGQLPQHGLAFLLQVVAELGQIGQHTLSFRVALQELRQIRRVLLEHPGQCEQVVDARFTSLAGHNRRRHVHAVQNVAHVVQDSGGDLGHAGLAGEAP